MSPTSDPIPTDSSPLGYALLLLAVAWTMRAARQENPGNKLGWRWWALMGAVLLAFRWPLLWVPHQFNPDESQLIAGALTLRHDPVFWRSVDGGTAGPLDFFPLLPATWVSGVASYAVARLGAVLALLAALGFAGETVALLAGANAARLAMLPGVAFYAFTTNPDFTHASTELVPLVLLGLAGWCAARAETSNAKTPWWSAALLLGAVPWAKLQAAPFAVALGALLAWRAHATGRRHLLGPLAIGALVPTLLISGLAFLGGQFEPMIVTYFLYNLAYFDAPQFTWAGNLLAQAHNTVIDGYLGSWLGGVTALALGSLVLLRRGPRPLRGQAALAVALLLIGLLCALAPRRPSAHHLHLITLPMVWLTGAVLAVHAGRGLGISRWAAGLVLTGGVVAPLAWRAATPDSFAVINRSAPEPSRLELAARVRQFSDPGESLAIWGSRLSLYVETGRRQATRQAHSGPQIHPGPLQRYYLQSYYEDFRAANPPVFVDAVGPGNFFFSDRQQAHEAFPPLRAWIRDHYVLTTELDGARLFVRSDRLSRSPASH